MILKCRFDIIAIQLNLFLKFQDKLLTKIAVTGIINV
jgi:hypothetical protein